MNDTVRDLTLLLLYLTSWDEKIPGGSVKRSWKGYPFDALNELEKKRYLSGGMKSKSVYLSEKGAAFAKKLVSKYYVGGMEKKVKTRPKVSDKESYVFDIEIMNIEPRIWRRLEIPASTTLDQLAYIILVMFGWDGGHLHEFTIGKKDYGMKETDEYGTDLIDEKDVKLSEFGPAALKRFRFDYDFGDGWQHDIKLKSSGTLKGSEPYPVCTGGARHAPPDDCGAEPGYYKILEALKNKADPTEEQKELLVWLGDNYDPEEFNVMEINAEIKNPKRLVKYFESLTD
jgi:hypothetical protein